MTIPRPKRGFVSNQLRVSRRATTPPTTRIEGGANPRSLALPAISPRVPISVSWSGVVPQRIRAAGVAASFPWRIRFSVTPERFLIAMRTTSVPIPASVGQSRVLFPLAGSSWPVTKATEAVWFRWVSGIPA